VSRARTFLVVAVCAAAFGGLAGAVAVALRDPPVRTAPATRPDAGTGAPEVRPSTPPTVDDGEPGSGSAPTGFTRRLDDPDPAVRHALALELLRRGPDALPQARALRPTTPEGADLQTRLVVALNKMKLLHRAEGWQRMGEHLRRGLDLHAFESVVPETLLVDERVAYWAREIDAVDVRLRRNLAEPGERSLAELELAFARLQGGRLGEDDYAAEATRLLPEIERFVGTRRADRAVAPAEVEELERQIARLRP